MGKTGNDDTLLTMLSSPHLSIGFKLYVSDSGEQVLMLTSSVEFYLWEVGPHAPQWWKLFPPRAVLLPQASYRETAVDAGFYVHQVQI